MQIDNQHGGSRKEIVRWVNTLLDLKVGSVEQLGTGAVYCQLLDILKPGIVVLSKVNWKAKQEYEYINNYKVLQTAIRNLGIDIKLDVQKLVKCKYQDNFEMIQLLKKTLQRNGIPPDYDAIGRRNSTTQLPIKNNPGNKENILRKSGSGASLGFSLTSKPSQKNLGYSSNTSKSYKQAQKNILQISSFIPDKQKSDQQKLRLIKEVFLKDGSNQLQEIKNIVFEQEDSQIQSEQQLDII